MTKVKEIARLIGVAELFKKILEMDEIKLSENPIIQAAFNI
jgi:hypothetical protein